MPIQGIYCASECRFADMRTDICVMCSARWLASNAPHEQQWLQLVLQLQSLLAAEAHAYAILGVCCLCMHLCGCVCVRVCVQV